MTHKYTGTLQFFHNFEHSPKGLNHCHSEGRFSYQIRHENGKHIISSSVACGHGKGGKPQFFKFTKELGNGFDMASGVRIKRPPSKNGNNNNTRKAVPSSKRPVISKGRIRITPKRPRIGR